MLQNEANGADQALEAEIQESVDHFRRLLEQQIIRTRRMAQAEKPLDFAALDPLVIGIIGGDGIGPFLVREAERVLRHVLKEDIASGRIEIRNIEGLTIENRMKKMQSVPEDILTEIQQCHVLLKGPTETPKGGRMESANVSLRRALDLYANVRPVSVPEEDIDWTFFRENTEGEYVLGSQGIELPGRLAMDFKVTTDLGTRRIVRAAFEYAKANGKDNVAIVTKANIMKKTDGNFSRIAHEVARDYPGIKADDWYIDIMTANLLVPGKRSKYQVFVLPNLYGDILTDEAAQIQGGVGTAGSANLGDRYAMFEAIHGSAPRMVEEGRGEYCNPSSLFKATELLLSHIGKSREASQLSKAMTICLETEKRLVITGRSDGATCGEFADYVMETMAKL